MLRAISRMRVLSSSAHIPITLKNLISITPCAASWFKLGKGCTWVKSQWQSTDFSLPAERVVLSLDRIIEWRCKPDTIRVDNGPEYISETLRSMVLQSNTSNLASPSRMFMSSAATGRFGMSGWINTSSKA